MSPVRHPVSGVALSFALETELETVRRELAHAAGRVARTLVKEGPLRLTLVGMGPGGHLRPHQAAGPIAVQVLEGAVEFEAEGRTWPLAAGALLVLDAGVTHEVRSAEGGFFLLTVVAPASEGAGSASPAAP